METNNSNAINRLCDGFLSYRQVRLNAVEFSDENAALAGSFVLLQKNMMFLALNNKMRCADCNQVCNASNCGFSDALTVTAVEIIKHWQRPKIKTIQHITHTAQVYIYANLLETLAEKANDAVKGEPDEGSASHIRARAYTWRQQRRQQLYDLLDEQCRLQPIYLSLMK